MHHKRRKYLELARKQTSRKDLQSTPSKGTSTTKLSLTEKKYATEVHLRKRLDTPTSAPKATGSKSNSDLKRYPKHLKAGLRGASRDAPKRVTSKGPPVQRDIHLEGTPRRIGDSPKPKDAFSKRNSISQGALGDCWVQEQVDSRLVRSFALLTRTFYGVPRDSRAHLLDVFSGFRRPQPERSETCDPRLSPKTRRRAAQTTIQSQQKYGPQKYYQQPRLAVCASRRWVHATGTADVKALIPQSSHQGREVMPQNMPKAKIVDLKSLHSNKTELHPKATHKVN